MPDEVTNVIERRTLDTALGPIEIRAEGDGDDAAVFIEGYAAVFDSETELWPGHSEKIAVGAFDDVLADGPDCRCLFNHDTNFPLGRTKISESLELSVDDTGLRYRNKMPPGANAEMVYQAIKRGDVSQSSFSFRTGAYEWDERADDDYLRTITRVDELYDVGPVTFAAYSDTSCEVAKRSFQEWRDARSAAAAAAAAAAGGGDGNGNNGDGNNGGGNGGGSRPSPSEPNPNPPPAAPTTLERAQEMVELNNLRDLAAAQREKITELEGERDRLKGALDAKKRENKGLLDSLK